MQPGATIRYLPQEPDLSAHQTTLAYVLAGLGPGDDPHQARFYLEQLGLAGDEDEPGHHGGRGLRAGLEEAAFDEEQIEARAFGHAVRV